MYTHMGEYTCSYTKGSCRGGWVTYWSSIEKQLDRRHINLGGFLEAGDDEGVVMPSGLGSAVEVYKLLWRKGGGGLERKAWETPRVLGQAYSVSIWVAIQRRDRKGTGEVLL